MTKSKQSKSIYGPEYFFEWNTSTFNLLRDMGISPNGRFGLSGTPSSRLFLHVNQLNMNVIHDNQFSWLSHTKDVGHFLQAQCLYPENTCKMSRISPDPYLHLTNGPLRNRNVWYIFRAILAFQIYHRPLWAKNTIPYFI